MFLEIKMKHITEKLNITHIVFIEIGESYFDVEMSTGATHHYPYEQIENLEMVKEIVENW